MKANIDGKEETLTQRITAKHWTFVIDTDGKIPSKNTSVVAADDSEAIMEVVAHLKKSDK